MNNRNERGQFIKGNKASPGRPRREVEAEYFNVMAGSVSIEDWKEIIKKAITQAQKGDGVARKWLSDYLMGTPVQRNEHTGADGSAMVINWRMIEGGKNDDV